jgi:hypothetical protein
MKYFNRLFVIVFFGYSAYRFGWDCLHPETWDGTINDPRVYLSLGAIAMIPVTLWIRHVYREHQKLMNFIREQQRLIESERKQQR